MKLLEKILVPVNFEEKYNPQVELALKVAQRFNSELILLHVLPSEAKAKAVHDIVVRSVNTEFKKLEEKFIDANVLTTRLVRYGNIFDQIITVSEDENVNVIIIGNENNKSENAFRIGILAEKLTRKAEKPVWVHRNDQSTEPENILCPVDFSDASDRALNNALKIARIFNSKLHIVNVFEPMGNLYSPRLNLDPDNLDKKNEIDNQKMFDSFIGKFNFSGIKYNVVALKGDPYKKISAFLKDNKIDLMLIGATGKTMLTRILIGSLTEQIARNLQCSLITVKAKNILNLKIDSDISNIEKHFENAKNMENTGYFAEAAEQLKICLQINDLHVPSLTNLIRLYEKLGEEEQAKIYKQKLDEILSRLWDKKIEFEIRRHYKINNV